MEGLGHNNHNVINQNRDNAECTTSSKDL